MKQVRLIAAALFLITISASCHRGNSITINGGDDNLSINYYGDIKFNDDETAIKSISHDGYLKYMRNDIKILAETDAHGEIKYELYDHGRKLNPDDEEGKMFLAEAIKDMIGIGFDAKGRLDRLYKRGGSRAVLNEVENLKMDYVKSMYLEYLFSADSMQQSDMAVIAKRIGSQIGSDYDKGRLLSKFPVEYLKDSTTAHAWFESVKSIGADYEKSNALVFIARQALTTEQFNKAVDVTNTIGSDYEKANVLKELINKRTFVEENFDKTLDAVSYIGSDFEKVNLLKALIEKERPSAGHFNKLLDVTEHVGSDFDKANLIKDVTRKNIKSEEQWISIINATAEVSSDFDKSNLLVIIAPDMPKSEQVKTAYMKVARTINAESDLGRAVKAAE